MREKIRDKGRLQHMLEMAYALREEKSSHSYEEILKDRILF